MRLVELSEVFVVALNFVGLLDHRRIQKFARQSSCQDGADDMQRVAQATKIAEVG